MAIGVSSSVHAAVTLYVTTGDDRSGEQFLQSPQGCILQRLPIGEAASGWLVLLDYGLDSGSCALCVVPFEAPTTPQATPVVPVLFHIDDRVKVILTVAQNPSGDGPTWLPINQSFHALLMNFQANQKELYPVDIGILPRTPGVEAPR
jgi:hypothetical protein